MARRGAGLLLAAWRETEAGRIETVNGSVEVSFGPAAFSPDERTVVLSAPLGDRQGGALFVDLASGRVVRRQLPHEDAIECMAFSPDGNKLATGGADERVVLWDVRANELIATSETGLIKISKIAVNAESASPSQSRTRNGEPPIIIEGQCESPRARARRVRNLRAPAAPSRRARLDSIWRAAA